MFQTYLNKIRKGLEQEKLPGSVAQMKMSHAMYIDRPAPKDENHYNAAVLALLYPSVDNVTTVAFILRSSRDPRDKHAGQIAFPGGRFDQTDINFATTAVREAEEEIGVPQADITILGELTALYIPVSNFLVRPFIGYVEHRPDFVPQPSEVDDIIEVPLDAFLRDGARQESRMKMANGDILDHVPYWAVHPDHKIWGATSMIMSEIIALLD